mmetsp:Transcript_24378/g.36167  ORF Transcript_24378/g.36167 Transcript_24378/m.36167 type:complete len:250 (+) Transcript_24378:69-818(+)
MAVIMYGVHRSPVSTLTVSVMLKSFFLIILIQEVTSFIPPISNRCRTTQLADITYDLYEAWSNAAMVGDDAVGRTANFIKDRAFDYKNEVLSRMKENSQKFDNINEDSIEKAASEYFGAQTEKKYQTMYKIAVGQAEIDLMNAINKQEGIFLEEMNKIVSDYDYALSQTQDGLTEEDIFSATRQYIQRSAAVDELFEIAIERAELAYKVELIEAEEARNEEVQFYEKHGRYKPEKLDYLSVTFANQIAF